MQKLLQGERRRGGSRGRSWQDSRLLAQSRPSSVLVSQRLHDDVLCTMTWSRQRSYTGGGFFCWCERRIIGPVGKCRSFIPRGRR